MNKLSKFNSQELTLAEMNEAYGGNQMTIAATIMAFYVIPLTWTYPHLHGT